MDDVADKFKDTFGIADKDDENKPVVEEEDKKTILEEVDSEDETTTPEPRMLPE